MKKSQLRSIKKAAGFTIIELLVFVIVITAAGLFAVTNIRGARAQDRDSTRKIDINTLTYQLEKSYEDKKYYPEKLDGSTVKDIDEDTLTDSNGLKVNDPGSNYQYRPSDCKEAKCSGYTLTAQLEKEAPYIKESLR